MADDVYDNGVNEAAPTIVYWPVLMGPFWDDPVRVSRGGAFVIRTSRAGTETFLADARKAVWSVNPNLPVFLVRTLGDIYDRSMQRTSFTLVMLGVAGGMALSWGLSGIYGVISYRFRRGRARSASAWRSGAEDGALTRMFVRHGLILAAIGVTIGLVAAAGVTRLMTSLLFGVTALDPATYVAVPIMLAAAAMLASYVPARRTVRWILYEALRAE